MDNTTRLLILAAEDFTGLWDAVFEMAHEPSPEEAARRALEQLLTDGHVRLFRGINPALQAPVELDHEESRDALASGPHWSVPAEGTEGGLVYFAATDEGVSLIQRSHWGRDA
jgi:hypothetical protein